MEIIIREIDMDTQLHFGQCDSSFTVNSKLILYAENERISYTVVDVPPCTKKYDAHQTDFAEYASDPDKTIFLAYMNNEIAGQVRVTKYWNQYALIDDFVVDTKHRRQGVGRLLIARAIEWAKTSGFPGVTLETQNINVAASLLYESCGFELRGFDTHLYKGLNPATEEIALFWYLIF
ncbi:MAG: GNAT family N-acetyltransferase [Anaerolineales bacterium]